MSRRILVYALAIALFGIPIAASPAARAADPRVSVLADFGDGTYLWADVVLPPTNVTALKATELANASWSLPPMSVSWFDSPFCLRRPCAFVNDIGRRSPVYPVWWHFFVWNVTASGWERAPYGPSDTDLADGASIAWYLAVDDPATYAAPRPVPTPDFRDVWTSFRGDVHNTGLAHGTIPVTNHLRWDHDVGVKEIDTTPVVAYGNVYVATRNALVALDAGTGEEVWRNALVHDLLSTPAVYDGHLVLGGTDGRLHYVNAFNGTEEWSILVEPGARSTGIASSPTVYMGRAYVGTFNESAGGKGRVVAVNLNNGTIAWAFDAPGVIHMSKPLLAGAYLWVGVMGTYDGAVGFSPPYGLLAVAFDGSAGGMAVNTSASVAGTPAVAPSFVFGTYCKIFFAAKDGYLYDNDLCLDYQIQWGRRSVGPSVSSPVAGLRYVVVGTGGVGGGGNLSAITFGGTGDRTWSADVGGAVESSLVSDGRLVCGATNVANGAYVCVRVSDGAVVWTYTPTPHDYVLGSPVVVGDTLYAPSDNGHIYAFRDADPGANPLLDLEVSGPSPCLIGQICSPGFEVIGLGPGRAVNVTLTITLPPGWRRGSETVEQASAPRDVVVNLGDWVPGRNESTALGGTEILPGYPSLTFRARLSYQDMAGRAYPDIERTATITPTTPPPTGPPWVMFAVVSAAIVLAIAAGSLLWRRRRKADDA